MQVAAGDLDRGCVCHLDAGAVLGELRSRDDNDSVLECGQADGIVLIDGAVADGQLSVTANEHSDLTGARDVNVVKHDFRFSAYQHSELEAADVHPGYLGLALEDQRRLRVVPDRAGQTHHVAVSGDGDAVRDVRVRRRREPAEVCRPHLSTYRIVGAPG